MTGKISQESYYMKLMKVAACQLNVLNIFDPENEDNRALEYDTASSADIEGDYTRHMISVIHDYSEKIKGYLEMMNAGNEEPNEELRRQLSQLEELSKEISKAEIRA
jgi:hypothetical protein